MNIRYFSKSGLNFIEVANDLDLKVVLCDLGASVFQIYFDHTLMSRNVATIEDYKLPNCYYGKTVGRTFNRLKGYRFEIHDEVYTLEKNEGNNVLHGGVNGLSTKKFSPSVKAYGWYIEVRYHYDSPHLEAGYPGNVNLDVIYIIYKDNNRLDIRYEASSDLDTLFSLSNHTFFTLGDKDISNIELFIRGGHYLKVDRDLLPISKIEVSPTFDFRKYQLLANEYDNFFYFDEMNPTLINVSLRNKKYRMDIFTNFEGAQVYTSNNVPNFSLKDSDNLPHDSVAVEPSDSFLYFPVLKKGEQYTRGISYIFLKR